MSSQELAVSGKDNFTVAQLIAALETGQTTVPANADTAGLKLSNDVATEADWERFWTAINKVNTPVASPLDNSSLSDDSKPSPIVPVISAVSGMISIASTVYNNFSGLTDVNGRAEWTRDMIARARRINPALNYVVVLSDSHVCNMFGTQNIDWAVDWYNYPSKAGTYRYAMYAFRGGVVSLIVDGGYEKWAFAYYIYSDHWPGTTPRTITFY